MQVNESHQRTDNILGDGQAYKDHVLFQNHPNALQIMLYYDVEPIGSKAKTQIRSV